MPFEKPLTIKEVIPYIDEKKYLLPSIQRELVWNTYQIERLFDSLMRNYPIGSFLFWYVDKKRSKDYQFYEFLRNYSELDKRHNPKANISGHDDIVAVLDGQQRLTALYIGLKGTYSYKIPYKRWDNKAAYPERKLYLNILEKSNRNNDLEYDFQFLTKEESKHRDENYFWFKVGDILDLEDEYQVNDLLMESVYDAGKEKFQFANKTLFKLHSVIHKDPAINYFLEKDEKLDKVLNIFIRVNSGGTQLSYSDLLLSIASAQWQEKDAREEITQFVEEINSIGDGFYFDKDFVLKSCLVLNDFSDIAFKVDNFNKKNMLTIEKNWDNISQAIGLAVTLAASYGYNRDTLTANNAIIPISYYLLKRGLPRNFVQSSNYLEDRKRIQKWLILSLLKRTFGGQPDEVLRPTREILSKDNSCFPLTDIVERFRGETRSIVFSEDDIKNLFQYQYGQRYTFSTLTLLYPSLDFRNRFHQDHVFPKSFFTKKRIIKRGVEQDKADFYLSNFNNLANLQLLEGVPNQEKSDTDFKEWLYKTYPKQQDRKDYMQKHYIPDIDLGFNNFENFILERKKLMSENFRSILKL